MMCMHVKMKASLYYLYLERDVEALMVHAILETMPAQASKLDVKRLYDRQW